MGGGDFRMRKAVRIMTDASVKRGTVIAGKLPVLFADHCACTITVSWMKTQPLDHTAILDRCILGIWIYSDAVANMRPWDSA